VVRFKQEKENTKPIVLMISWFYGQKSQINKYSKLYTDQGMDVLVGRISLIQFLFNIKSVEVSGGHFYVMQHLTFHNSHSNLARTSPMFFRATRITTRKFSSTLSQLEVECGEFHSA
jgi:hypothetical protein